MITYLRYLCKLSVCLAALVRRLHSNLIVIHKRPVHSKLAGLQGTSRGLIRFVPIEKGERLLVCDFHWVLSLYAVLRLELA